MIDVLISTGAAVIAGALVYGTLRLIGYLTQKTGPLVSTGRGQAYVIATMSVLIGCFSLAITDLTSHTPSLWFWLTWQVLVFGGMATLLSIPFITDYIDKRTRNTALAGQGRPVPPRVKKPSLLAAFALIFLWGMPGVVGVTLFSALSVEASGSTVDPTESYAQTQPVLLGYMAMVMALVALRYFLKDRRYAYEWRLYHLQSNAQS